MAVSGSKRTCSSYEKMEFRSLIRCMGKFRLLSNKCEIGEDCAYFEYLEQENLAEYLDDLLGKGEKEKAEKISQNIWKMYRSFTARSRSQ